MGRIGRIGLIGLIGLVVLAAAAIAATYTAPAPQSSRSGWSTNRYASPAAGLMVVDVTSDGVTDQDITIGGSSDAAGPLDGYLERIVVAADGDDAAWSLTILDAQGVTLFTKSDFSATGDPYSYVVASTDVDGTSYGGVPFFGGLTFRLADADDGTTTAVNVRAYITETWRR